MNQNKLDALVEITAIMLRADMRGAVPTVQEVEHWLDRTLKNFSYDFADAKPSDRAAAKAELVERLIPNPS